MPGQIVPLEKLTVKDYKVIVQQPVQGPETSFDVTGLCISISWNYDIDQPIETYELEFAKATDLLKILQCGSWIYIIGWRPDPVKDIDYGIIKQGIIWDIDLSTADGGGIKVTAHDMMIYLTNNKGSHRLQTGEKASDFIKRICPLYGIQTDQVDDTQLAMPYPLPFINQTIFNMFATALQNTRDIGFSGRVEGDTIQYGALRYFLQSRGFKLALVQKREAAFAWMFSSGDTNNPGSVISATNKFSLDSYRNVVKVYRAANPDASGVDASGGLLTVDADPVMTAAAPPEESWPNDLDIKRYGMLSESVEFQDYSEAQLAIPDQPEQAQWQADDLLRRLKKLWNSGSVNTFNIPTIRAGDPVFVNCAEIALSGKYYVKSGNHTITSKGSEMNLAISFEDFLPFVYKSKHETQTDVLNLGL